MNSLMGSACTKSDAECIDDVKVIPNLEKEELTDDIKNVVPENVDAKRAEKGKHQQLENIEDTKSGFPCFRRSQKF